MPLKLVGLGSCEAHCESQAGPQPEYGQHKQLHVKLPSWLVICGQLLQQLTDGLQGKLLSLPWEWQTCTNWHVLTLRVMHCSTADRTSC